MYKSFKTQKALKEYVREVVDTIGECESIEKYYPEHLELFYYLFKRHSDYPEKFEGLLDIKIRYNKRYKKQLECIISKVDEAEEAVSILNNCIRGKPVDQLHSAMRTAIESQTLYFRNNNKHICELCGSSSHIHVDHFEPQFIDLKNNFLSICDIQTPKSFTHNNSNAKMFKNKDKDFKNSWYNYHKKHAILRILCSKCNLVRKKSKR